jgi:hypothetical protein
LLLVQSWDSPFRVGSILPARRLHALTHLHHCLVLVGLLLTRKLLVIYVIALHITTSRDRSVRSRDRRQSLPQPSKLESEPWADLLQFRRSRRFESIPMATEEEEVSLIVQRDDLSAAELGLGREQSTKDSSDRVSEQSGEVIQDELGCDVSGRYSRVSW